MVIPLDEVVHFDVVTSDPLATSVADADSTPTFSVYEEATDVAIVGPTNFTKRTSLTGNYRGTFTASVANGFELGKWYNVIASATVSEFAGKCVALRFRVVAAEPSPGYPDLTGATVKAVVDPVKIQSGITKNAALANFKFLMISSADHISGKAGLTITAERSIDDGAFAACANAATELSGGAYEIDFAQTDLNGDVVMFKFTAPGADPRFMTIRTTP